MRTTHSGTARTLRRGRLYHAQASGGGRQILPRNAVPAIETEHLTKRFRRVRGYRDLALYPWRRPAETALDDVSLAVAEGELFGLLGENGAGKTTLIRILSTTLLPTSGSARVGGHDVTRDPQAIRRLIGLVSGDERSFYWRLTGRQNLEYFAALYHLPKRVARARIAELVSTLGVNDYADRRFDSFSTGIRQKFAIARGMLTEPRILFLDEPTRALDPIAADEVRRLVAGHIVGELGYTVLLATHTLSEAESICHRVAIVRRGRLIEVGTVPELRQRTLVGSTLEIDLTAITVELIPAIEAIEGVDRAHAVELDSGCRLVVRFSGSDTAMNRVLEAVIRSGARIEACTTREATLEDIYRAAHALD